MHSKLLNQNMDRAEIVVVQCHFLLLHGLEYNVSKTWNITIYLINYLVTSM